MGKAAKIRSKKMHRLSSSYAMDFTIVRKASSGAPASELTAECWNNSINFRTMLARAESGSPAPVVVALSVSCSGEIASAREC